MIRRFSTISSAWVTTPSGLRYLDKAIGTGGYPKIGDVVFIHYTGKLSDGTIFDTSKSNSEPFSFKFGIRQVIAGWDEGISTMRCGGSRTLLIPPHLGYGFKTAGKIPAGSTLEFDCELISIGFPLEMNLWSKVKFKLSNFFKLFTSG